MTPPPSASNPPWQELVGRLQQDEGAFLDVLVPGTGMVGWQKVLDLPRRNGWPYKYTQDGERKRVPPAQEVFERTKVELCIFEFQPGPDLVIRTAFWDDEVPHLWFDPAYIDSEEQLRGVFHFLRALGRIEDADVVVTVDGHPEWVYLRYDRGSDVVLVVEPRHT